jgi:activator of HSP90 ATPase
MPLAEWRARGKRSTVEILFHERGGAMSSRMVLFATLALVGATGVRAGGPEQASPAAVAPKGVMIRQEVDLDASPEKVYEALLDQATFAAFSGAKAEIHREVGGAFSLFEGHIVGRNVELVPNRRVVQAWRAVTWPEGVYSIARFELTPSGGGTHVVFEHTGFPEDQRDHLAQGWQEHYWDRLRKHFSS